MFHLSIDNFIRAQHILIISTPVFPLCLPNHPKHVPPLQFPSTSIFFCSPLRAQLELPTGVLKDLVDLALYRACASNHSSSEFLSAMTMSCADDSILWNPFLSSILVWPNVSHNVLAEWEGWNRCLLSAELSMVSNLQDSDQRYEFLCCFPQQKWF